MDEVTLALAERNSQQTYRLPTQELFHRHNQVIQVRRHL
jgi:hypothetical protein